MHWYKFKAGKHHLSVAEPTMFGYGKTACGLRIDETAKRVNISYDIWPIQQLTNICKNCLKSA